MRESLKFRSYSENVKITSSSHVIEFFFFQTFVFKNSLMIKEPILAQSLLVIVHVDKLIIKTRNITLI